MATKKRGGQTKEERIKNRIEKMESQLERAILEGNELIVNNYLKYMKVLDDAALNTTGKFSATNQISSSKILIERAEKLLAEAESKGESSHKEEAPSENEYTPLISLVADEG